MNVFGGLFSSGYSKGWLLSNFQRNQTPEIIITRHFNPISIAINEMSSICMLLMYIITHGGYAFVLSQNHESLIAILTSELQFVIKNNLEYSNYIILANAGIPHVFNCVGPLPTHHNLSKYEIYIFSMRGSSKR